MDTVHTTVNLA